LIERRAEGELEASAMAILRRVWQVFVHLFGLDSCPVPPHTTSKPKTGKKKSR